MITRKRTSAAALALLFCLTLLLSLPGQASAEKQYIAPNRYNVVLVVDKSGSLCCEGGTGTDPDGLRFDALRLFLGLLTESGNNVGAIVFDEHIRYESPITTMNSMDDKKALIHTLEGYGPGYDTDIGTAMLRAAEMLRDIKQENNLPCMILLFSDGKTDFTTGDVLGRFRTSWSNAEQAVKLAQEEGIVINGILLNVKNAADRGVEEFRLYTYRTTGTVTGENGEAVVRSGEFEEVKEAKDLGPAFRRLYRIVTSAAYTGDQRVSFDTQGKAETTFTVPSFGVEEVNVIIEGEELRPNESKKATDAERVSVEIIRPDGERYDVDGRALESSRYIFYKIPSPDLGVWRVNLTGQPKDWVDITMVGSATLSASLEGTEAVETFRSHTPYAFKATVTDSAVSSLTPEQLGMLNAVLVREDPTTGIVHEYPAASLEGNTFRFEDVTFPKGGFFELTAVFSLGDFSIPSNKLVIPVDLAPLVPSADSITNMLDFGYFENGEWRLDLDSLFSTDRDSGVSYQLSDDCGGLVSVNNGLLRVRIQDAKPLSFAVTATDIMDQSASVSFHVAAPSVTAKASRFTDILSEGIYLDSQWEADLASFFDDPKGGALTYTLDGDRSGAVTIKDGKLFAHLDEETSHLSFTITATDMTQQSAALPFDITVPTVSARLDRVTNMMRLGQLHDYIWELPMEGLFTDADDSPLRYTLSDDCGGAVTISDNILRVDFHELRAADFSVTATNHLDRTASIPFSLKVPGPSVSVGPISETVKTGLFQEGIWERPLSALFSEPKGTAMTYALSDDFGGAARIENGTVHVDVKGLKKADFTVSATDEYGLKAELPVTIAEKNMTPIYLLIALAALLGLGGIVFGIVYWWRYYR